MEAVVAFGAAAAFAAAALLIFLIVRDFAAPGADHLVFWGMNVGMIGFVLGLAFESAVMKQAFSLIMGLAILIGLAVYVVRLWQADPIAAFAETADA